jgi:hypothetical protein
MRQSRRKSLFYGFNSDSFKGLYVHWNQILHGLTSFRIVHLILLSSPAANQAGSSFQF